MVLDVSNIFFSRSLRLSIHVPPKCGTHTVIKSIAYCENNLDDITDNKVSHAMFKKYRECPNGWKTYEKILLVRNPFARALSMFSNKAHRAYIHLKNKKYLTYHDFKTFLNYARGCTDHHIRPIVTQIRSVDEYSNIFYLEDLDSFYSFLKSRATTDEQYKNLEKLHKDNTFMNASSSYEKYRGYLTLEAVNKILNLYALDFSTFKYSKDKKDIFEVPDR